MIKVALNFVLVLVIVLAVAFGIHTFIQHITHVGSFESHIILNYTFNFLLTIGVFSALVYFEKKNSDQLGFIFLGASTFKLILFLVLIYPGIKAHTGLRSVEFASFFVPYTISVLAEILYLIRKLGQKHWVELNLKSFIWLRVNLLFFVLAIGLRYLLTGEKNLPTLVFRILILYVLLPRI